MLDLELTAPSHRRQGLRRHKCWLWVQIPQGCWRCRTDHCGLVCLDARCYLTVSVAGSPGQTLCPGSLRAEVQHQLCWGPGLAWGSTHGQAPHLLAELTSWWPRKLWHFRHRQQRGEKLCYFESLIPAKPWTRFEGARLIRPGPPQESLSFLLIQSQVIRDPLSLSHSPSFPHLLAAPPSS